MSERVRAGAIRQGQGGSHHHAVAGVDTHRVHVFHGTDGDHVAQGVPHGFELDFLPAGDAFFNENLGDGGGIETAAGDLLHLLLIVRDSAAAAAQGVCRAHDDGIADVVGNPEGLFEGFGDAGRHAGLVDGKHGFPELFPVLRFLDGFDGRAQQADAEFVQRAVPAELHGEGQPRLAAETGDQAVRALFLDDPADGGRVQGLQIDLVRQMLIGHDGGGVGIDKHHIDAFRLQHAAGLGAGIVELGGLADDDRAGADDQDFADGRIFRH